MAKPTSHEPKVSKASIVEAMLAKASGATIADMNEATGWQPHSCRAFLTGLKKKGKIIERTTRKDGASSYRIVRSRKVGMAPPISAQTPDPN